MSEIILEMIDIVKEFPGVRALDHVNFRVKKGEVLALVGENGAGKSTLVKVLSGIWPYPEYEGDIYLDDELVHFNNTREAEKAGIGIIHQELNLIQDLTVAENIFLDRQALNFFGGIIWEKVHSDTAKLLKRLNMNIESTTILRELTVGKQQMVEIAKALSLETKILVFDEPTSALTDSEITELFRIIRELKKDGVAIIYISHKLEEIKEIADEVTVLRDGSSIGDVTPIDEITLDEVITRMVGRAIEDMYTKQEFRRGEKTFEVKGLTVKHPKLKDKYLVKNVSFEAYKGELLGISGLMGAGRTELVKAIFGAYSKGKRGEVFLNGKKLDIKSPEDAIKNGIGLITEDRKEEGLILDKDLAFNMTLPAMDKFIEGNSLNHLKEVKITERYVEDLNIKTPSIKVMIENLSGGNQQKVAIGKWLVTESDVLILDEPTRGIDVGAKIEVYRLMNKLIEEGVTIIMISSELPEIMGMSDRIMVMYEGEKVVELSREEASKEKIMEYATGSFKRGENK